MKREKNKREGKFPPLYISVPPVLRGRKNFGCPQALAAKDATLSGFHGASWGTCGRSNCCTHEGNVIDFKTMGSQGGDRSIRR
ncbi:hypothetical protein QG37_06617 [Candidozyma auris]|nr:hypothetical protein QG37_06617 [[Candida] auris]